MTPFLPVKNGISSLRDRSTPKASAIVDSFFMLFSRNCVQKKKKENGGLRKGDVPKLQSDAYSIPK